jgi:hypothetical protein
LNTALGKLNQEIQQRTAALKSSVALLRGLQSGPLRQMRIRAQWLKEDHQRKDDAYFQQFSSGLFEEVSRIQQTVEILQGMLGGDDSPPQPGSPPVGAATVRAGAAPAVTGQASPMPLKPAPVAAGGGPKR